MSYMRVFETEAERYYAPDYVRQDLILMVVGGSRAYGIASPTSDVDLYGVCMPPLQEVFPHLAGYIPGFGKPPYMFKLWDHQSSRYDFNVYSLVRFFDLASRGNPNIIELLYVPEENIIHSSPLGYHLIEIADIFLSREMIPKFMGYYYSQKQKMFKYVDATHMDAGYGTKAAYHSMRLLLELEDILTTGSIHIQSNAKFLQAIRDGNMDPMDLEVLFGIQEDKVKEAAKKSDLPESPNLDLIRGYMVNMMHDYYDHPISWE